MKSILLVLILVLMVGCVGTPYERCVKNDEYLRWGGLDTCVATKTAQDVEFRYNMNHAFDGMKQQRSNTNCTSQVLGNQIYTNCY